MIFLKGPRWSVNVIPGKGSKVIINFMSALGSTPGAARGTFEG